MTNTVSTIMRRVWHMMNPARRGAALGLRLANLEDLDLNLYIIRVHTAPHFHFSSDREAYFCQLSLIKKRAIHAEDTLPIDRFCRLRRYDLWQTIDRFGIE